jgi:hypothetical protein
MLSAVSFLFDPGCGAGIANVPSIVSGSSRGWSPLATVEAEPTAEKEDENNDDD